MCDMKSDINYQLWHLKIIGNKVLSHYFMMKFGNANINILLLANLCFNIIILWINEDVIWSR